MKRVVGLLLFALVVAGCSSSGSGASSANNGTSSDGSSEASAPKCDASLKAPGVYACLMDPGSSSQRITEVAAKFEDLASKCPDGQTGRKLADMATVAKKQVGDAASYKDVYDQLPTIIDAASSSGVSCVEAISTWVINMNPNPNNVN